MSAPRVLVLGGCGFIGRNFVEYLSENKLASYIKVADKKTPFTAVMNDQHKAVFENKDLVKFKQSDLARPDHCARLFEEEKKFDYVFNLCGETRCALSDADYKKNIVETCVAAANAAKTAGVNKWIEVSTAALYTKSKNANNEDGEINPWTKVATFRHQAEEALAKIGIPHVVLRPAIVYGPGDLTGLTPRIACAAAYKKLGEKMKFLWTASLKINVVHVQDVCKALWIAATQLGDGSVYNLADSADLDQGTLNAYLGNIFGISTGFHGKIKSNLARLNLSAVAETANDKHLDPWQELCREHKTLNTPISPYIDTELLRNNSLWINGSKITQDSDFSYDHAVSEQKIREQIEGFIQQGIFPPVL